MRVGFDVTPLVRPFPQGVVRACAELLAALERRARIEVVRLAPPASVALSAWRRSGLPAAVADARLVGLHSFTSAYPWRGGGRRVQTIHEAPWRHRVAENADWRHRAWARLGLWKADRVVTPTAHVARDLAPRRAPQKLRVVPWGVGPPFAAEPPPGCIDEAVLGRYRLGEEPFALALGANRAKKGLERVLHGLAERARRGEPSLRLIVTGGDTPTLRRHLGLATRLGLARAVTTLDVVAEEDLPALLRLAAVVPVLSHSEGFGLPVAEAMACGTPVVVPRSSAQAEVAGAAGLLVDADEPAAVAAALSRATGERARWSAAGLARAAELSWDASAEALERVWQELA